MRTRSMIRPVAGLFILSGFIFGLTACGSADVEVTDGAVEEKPKEEAKEEAPVPAPAKGGVMTVDSLNANREANVGKLVKVSGFYQGTTKQGNPVEQINVSVQATADKPEGEEKAQKLLCVASPENEAMFDGIAQKSEISVMGTVDDKDFFGGAMLRDCVIGKAGGGKKEGGDKKEGGGGKGKKSKKGKNKKKK